MKYYYTLAMTRTGETINEHKTRHDRETFCVRHPGAVKISPHDAWNALRGMRGKNVSEMENRLFKRLRLKVANPHS